MSASAQINEYLIQGLTEDGETFRPSDWAERLCGVLVSFCPEILDAETESQDGAIRRPAYSPYVRPITLNNIKCVAVDKKLGELAPMAFNFVMNFAKDNHLHIIEACALPDVPTRKNKNL